MRSLSKRSIRYYLYCKLFESADGITGCSKFLINQFQEKFRGINPDKCFVIYNGVGQVFLKKELNNNKEDYVFSAARFEPIKGLDLIGKLANTNDINKLFIAGGDENDFMELGIPLGDAIIVLGSLSHDEIAQYLTQAEITVIPSRGESFGILVAEAICCGSPVVATNVGGIPEVIALATEKLSLNEKEIFNRWVKLVEPNVESIRNGIDALLKNNGSIEYYINLVPKSRNNFLWSTRLYKFQTILAEL